jgi:glycopeptide antibiotics resistance protein
MQDFFCYNLAVMRALLTITFMVVFILWLQYEFKKKVSFTKYWRWIAAALILQALSGIAFSAINDRVFGNFIYHAVGGGVMTTLFAVYLLKTYGQRYTWRVELVLLFGFVSALGVLNELAEYATELSLNKNGLLSWDSHDTWRDLAANTSGALLAWLLYRLYLRFYETR